jgi:hypothetical protein
MIIADVIGQERDALMSEYLFPEGVLGGENVPPYCAAPDIQRIVSTPRYLRQKHPVRIEELAGDRKGRAFVQHCPSLQYHFLWAHVTNDEYRNDYIQFLKSHHGIKVPVLPLTHHVDHLFNCKRAQAMQLPWVRMGLVPKNVNSSHGGGYERARTQGGIGTTGRQRGIDDVVLMKLWGVFSPRKGIPLTSEMIAHAQRMAGLFGLPTAEIERNIHELMDVAKFRPAG